MHMESKIQTGRAITNEECHHPGICGYTGYRVYRIQGLLEKHVFLDGLIESDY